MVDLRLLALLLVLVEIVELELRPHEVGLLGIFLNSPPEPAFEQALDQEEVVAGSHVVLVPVFWFEGVGLLEDDWVVDAMGEVEHEQEFTVGSDLQVVDREVAFVSQLCWRLLLRL